MASLGACMEDDCLVLYATVSMSGSQRSASTSASIVIACKVCSHQANSGPGARKNYNS